MKYSSTQAGPRTDLAIKETDKLLRTLEHSCQDAAQGDVQGRAERQRVHERVPTLRKHISTALHKKSRVDWKLVLDGLRFLKELAEWFSTTQNCIFPWSALNDDRVYHKNVEAAPQHDSTGIGRGTWRIEGVPVAG